MLLMIFFFSCILRSYFLLNSASHLGKIISCSSYTICLLASQGFPVLVSPDHLPTASCTLTSLNEFFQQPARAGRNSPILQKICQGYPGNNLQSLDSDSGLLIVEVSFHYTTAPSAAEIDSWNY